jgi:hypothetical protein
LPTDCIHVPCMIFKRRSYYFTKRHVLCKRDTMCLLRLVLWILYWSYLIYKDKCLFVCTELVQIHISEPIWTKLCTRLSLGLEEIVGYVWTHNILTFLPFRPILSRASTNSWAEDDCRRQNLPLCVISRVCVTSRTWSALCIMHRKRGEVNGVYVRGNGSLMRREGSE